MYDYEAFWKKYPVDQHDVPERHLATAALVRGCLLDVGCGTGCLADYYSGPYFGLDISNEAIKKARATRRENATFGVRDCSDFFGYDFGSYDTIALCEFLEHVESDEKIFDVIKATAKPGARLIISVPNGDRIPCDEHVRTFTVPELRKKFALLGRVRFHNWPGFNRQILLTVDLGVLNTDDLALVMIAKNEALGLERAILSCVGLVDQIVVAVDDSSSDETEKIARRYSDIVKMYKWSDDFSFARNFAHEGISSKWLLFLDGHEYVSRHENLEKMLASSVEGLLVLVELENGSSFRSPRIYRNGLEFIGKVHEHVNLTTSGIYTDFVVKHDRLTGQSAEGGKMRDVQRDDQVPRIMGEQLRQNPKNLRAAFHLALHYHSKNKFKEALRYQKIYLKNSIYTGERWYMFLNRSLCHLALGHHLRALWAADAADKEVPGRWEVEKLRGLIYFAVGKYKDAIEHFIASFKVNTGDISYQPWAHDDCGTWNVVGEAFFRLGQYFEAFSSFKRAAEVCEKKELLGVLEDRAKLMFEMSKDR